MLVYSVDCLAKTVLEIKDGVYTAAVYQNPPALAAANLKAAYDLLTGAETVVNTSVDSLLCTSDNVDQFIQMYIDQETIRQKMKQNLMDMKPEVQPILDEQSPIQKARKQLKKLLMILLKKLRKKLNK